MTVEDERNRLPLGFGLVLGWFRVVLDCFCVVLAGRLVLGPTLTGPFQLSQTATGTSLRPIADMFLEHNLDPKPPNKICGFKLV